MTMRRFCGAWPGGHRPRRHRGVPQNQMTPVVSFNTEADMSMIRDDIAIEQGHYRVRDVRRGSDVEEGKYLHVMARSVAKA